MMKLLQLRKTIDVIPDETPILLSIGHEAISELGTMYIDEYYVLSQKFENKCELLNYYFNKPELDYEVFSLGKNSISNGKIAFELTVTKEAVRAREIPFEISAESDPFYSASNIARLKKSIEEMESIG